MIMTSEGEKIKFIVAPQRDRKYAIVAYSKFIEDMINTIPNEVILIIIKALIELCFSAGGANGF